MTWWIVGVVGYVLAAITVAHLDVFFDDRPAPTGTAYITGFTVGWAIIPFWPFGLAGLWQRFFGSDDTADADNYASAGNDGNWNRIHGLATTAKNGKVVVDLEEPSPEPVESDEPLIGFRQWRLFEIQDGTLRLASSIRPFTYDGPVVTTSVEDVQSGHGLHAAKNGDKFYDPAPQYPVEGEVELFGRVVEGRRGYRAERLKIRSLTLYPGGWSDRPGQWSNGMLQTCRVPDDSVRQFASSELTETPWPHPFESLAKRLEKRYRCDVEIGKRDGSPILDADSSSASNGEREYFFTQTPSDTDVAKFSSGGELWTPREPDESGSQSGGMIMPDRFTRQTAKHIRQSYQPTQTRTLKRSFDIGA